MAKQDGEEVGREGGLGVPVSHTVNLNPFPQWWAGGFLPTDLKTKLAEMPPADQKGILDDIDRTMRGTLLMPGEIVTAVREKIARREEVLARVGLPERNGIDRLAFRDGEIVGVTAVTGDTRSAREVIAAVLAKAGAVEVQSSEVVRIERNGDRYSWHDGKVYLIPHKVLPPDPSLFEVKIQVPPGMMRDEVAEKVSREMLAAIEDVKVRGEDLPTKSFVGAFTPSAGYLRPNPEVSIPNGCAVPYTPKSETVTGTWTGDRTVDVGDGLNAVLARLRNAVDKARKKYPNGPTLLSLLDEVGEVVRAVNKGEGAQRVDEELTDVAAVCIRLLLREVDRRAVFGFVEALPDMAKHLEHDAVAFESAASTLERLFSNNDGPVRDLRVTLGDCAAAAWRAARRVRQGLVT